ncbi:MAG: chemotaxis protein CheA [Firmicutes bacterium]|nr:chemotaxis protein CheA [Candidatus Fermentithermobacillaceae bacterium]
MPPAPIEDSEEFRIFLDELGEMVELTEANLVELEKSPGDPGLISEVFRAMHTIKGGAATLGLEDGVKVTHAMETLLDEVRSGSRQLDSSMVDLLFSVLDWLKVWRDALSAGLSHPSPVSLLESIEEFSSSGALGPGPKRTAAVSGAWESETSLPPPLKEAIESALARGKTPAVLKVRFRRGAPLLSVRAYQVITYADEIADVLGSVPSAEDIEKDAVGEELSVYFVPAEKGDALVGAVSSVTDVSSASVEPVGLQGSTEAGASHRSPEELQSLAHHTGGGGRPVPEEPATALEISAGSSGGGRGSVAQGGPQTQRQGEAAPGHSGDASTGTGEGSKQAGTPTPANDAPVVRKTDLGRTVRVDVSLLDFLMDTVGELVIQRTRLTQIASKLQAEDETAAAGQDIGTLAAHLQRISQELQEGIMRARLLPLKNIFAKFPRLIRDLSAKCGKQVRFEMTGEDTELDRTVIEAIDDPLIHILRNAVDHGIETPEERRKKGKPPEGLIRLSAWHQENHVLIQVEDDGAGVDVEKVKEAAVKKGLMSREAVSNLDEKQALELIFLPGFSTAEKPTEVSGRGVGMDVVRENLQRVNGTVEVRTRRGHGTTVSLRLPLTVAIMRALLVLAGGWVYAVPTSSVEEVVDFSGKTLQTIQGKPTIVVRGRVFPLVSLQGVLEGDMWNVGKSCQYALLTRNGKNLMALAVDDLIGEEEIVVKEMGRLLSRVRGVAGATILADGDPAIILDVNYLV